jgi:hypothetical protein
VALDLVAELEGLVDAFDREGIDYAICGGIALGILGHPRATADIDLLIQPDVTDRAATVAKGCGFEIPGRKMALAKLDPETGELMSLDLMVVAHEFVAVWASRITAEFRGRTLKVVSRDGLATMKRIAGRPQDLADLAKLEGTDDDEG